MKNNTLAIANKELAAQWHPTKNGDLTPYDVTTGSNKKVWWLCEEGHEWQAIICNRALNNTDCPYCTGKKVLKGYNDLATVRPEIAKQWHPTKNGNLKPEDVTEFSQKKVWWICSEGHEWQTTVAKRSQGRGCPGCNQSYNEMRIENLLKKFNVNYQIQYRIEDCKNVIPLPFDFATFNSNGDLTALIEFDGKQHFEEIENFGGKEALRMTRKRDEIKNNYCKLNNITLIRIKYIDEDKAEMILSDLLNQIQKAA